MSKKEKNQETGGKEKKATRKETLKDNIVHLTDDDAEKAAGGSNPFRPREDQLRVG